MRMPKTDNAAAQLRLEILQDIVREYSPIAHSMHVGGSMGYGREQAVRHDSEIDLVLTLDSMDDLDKLPLASDTPKELLRNGEISMAWGKIQDEDATVNMFIYARQSLEDICLLRGRFSGWYQDMPKDFQTAFNFGGEELLVERKVRMISDGYIYTKPILQEGQFWGGAPREDFYYGSLVLHDPHDFLKNLEAQVWDATCRRLIVEHGPRVKLDRFNVLNAHYTNNISPERIPEKMKRAIQRRTTVANARAINALPTQPKVMRVSSQSLCNWAGHSAAREVR